MVLKTPVFPDYHSFLVEDNLVYLNIVNRQNSVVFKYLIQKTEVVFIDDVGINYKYLNN
jgi:hypothetical protein